MADITINRYNGPKLFLLTTIAAILSLAIVISINSTVTLSNKTSPRKSIRVSTVSKVIQRTSPKQTIYRKHIICPYFAGRAGNNLFQFASSFGIAKSKGMNVVINAHCYLLQAFNLKVDIRKNTSICSSPKVKIIRERKSATFDRRMTEFDNTSDVRLTIYLQSYLYFEKYENELRKQLTFKVTLQKKAIALLDSYLQKFGVKCRHHANSQTLKNIYFQNNFTQKVTLIGVHIRRGDWLKQKSRRLATREYLQKSVDLYKSMYDNLFFVVASNGIDWSKKNMPQNINVIYLEGNSVWVDLATVTLCEHFISTVGTFSWWAGWLTGGNVTYFKWPAQEGSHFRAVFGKDYKDHFYPKWIGL